MSDSKSKNPFKTGTIKVDEKDSKPEVKEAKESDEEPKEVEYVHTPGTPHLNAYYGAVQEAKDKLNQAQSELQVAEQALESKKLESQG